VNITSSQYVISSPSVDKCPAADRPEYAFIGRSNEGKSSLINMICNNENLAKTSRTPGKTQLINHFAIVSELEGVKGSKEEWYLVDLPGYGFAKVSLQSRKSWEKMIEDYLRKRENLVNVFVTVQLLKRRHNMLLVMAMKFVFHFSVCHIERSRNLPSYSGRFLLFFVLFRLLRRLFLRLLLALD